MAIQVDPKIFIPAEALEDWMTFQSSVQQIGFEAAFEQYLEATASDDPLTDDIPDMLPAAIAADYFPIIYHQNFQQRLADGDEDALAIARACSAWAIRQAHIRAVRATRSKRVRVTPFSEAKS